MKKNYYMCVCVWVGVSMYGFVCMGLYGCVCMWVLNGPNPGIVFFQEQKEMQRRKTL